MNITTLIDEYVSWLKNEITFQRFGEYYEITTPFLDQYNDYLQIYVKQERDTIYFSDDGAAIHRLKESGFNFNNKQKKIIQKTLEQYGARLEENEITAKAPAAGFAQAKHMFVQAIMRIDDMFGFLKTKSSSVFVNDVQEFFLENNIFYSENVQFTGHSGYTHNYDFLLQRSKTKPERLCQALNTPNQSYVGSTLFAWDDTKLTRKNDSQLIIFLNDQNNKIKGAEKAFNIYGAHIIKWSERNSNYSIDLLTA